MQAEIDTEEEPVFGTLNVSHSINRVSHQDEYLDGNPNLRVLILDEEATVEMNTAKMEGMMLQNDACEEEHIVARDVHVNGNLGIDFTTVLPEKGDIDIDLN